MKAVVSIDPRVKLLLFVVTCLFVMDSAGVWPNFFLGTYLAILLVLSGKFDFTWKSYSIYLAALLVGGYMRGIFPGVPGMLVLAVCVILRIAVPIMMAFTLVFQTTTISQFMAAFQKMHVSPKITIPFAVMFRFVPTVQEEWVNIRKAMAFRGIALSPFKVILHPANSVEHILVPLLFGAVSVMEELAAASLARGLDSDRKRTSLAKAKMRAWDYVFLGGTLVFAALRFMNYLRSL